MERQELPGLWLALHAHNTDSPEAILDLVRLSVVELAEMSIDDGRRAAGELPISLFKDIVETASESLDVGNSLGVNGSSPKSPYESDTRTPSLSPEQQAQEGYYSSLPLPEKAARKSAALDSKAQSKHTPRSS